MMCMACVQVMEDIWMGSALYRRPPSAPVTYVLIIAR